MAKFAPRLTSYLSRRIRPKKHIDVENAAHLMELAHWADKPVLRMNIPVSLLRMQGAFAYGSGHPFVAALLHGKAALARFYDTVTPSNLNDYYGLAKTERTGFDLPAWELPWYLRRSRTPPPGELHLGREHGVSFYGPVSAQKLDLEYQRLTGLHAALSAAPYDPDGHGDIEGYVLRHGPDACFFVRGGKHRTAVLTSLGHKTVPVSFRANFPRVVDTAQAAFWPLVRSGEMDETLAKDILAVYLAGQTDGTGNTANE